MATNPYVNKVEFGGQTLIDLTQDTVTANDVAEGVYFHLPSGQRTVGTSSGGAISVVDTTDTAGGIIRTITAVDISDTTATADKVQTGYYFYTADGTKTAGSLTPGITPTGNINLTAGTTDVTNYATATVASGTAGTPTATKGTVTSHSVTVTPSVTNVTGYITGSTINGTAVTVTVAELESGTKSISSNGTGISVSGYSEVDVAVPTVTITQTGSKLSIV